jgi:NADPH-dependent FMN reductase/YceI-like domain
MSVTDLALSATGLPVGTWRLDPVHSSASFAVKHMAVATFRGRFERLDADLTVEDSSAELVGTVDAGSIVVKDENLQAHLGSPDFFDIERYPEIAFRSTRGHTRGSGRSRYRPRDDYRSQRVRPGLQRAAADGRRRRRQRGQADRRARAHQGLMIDEAARCGRLVAPRLSQPQVAPSGGLPAPARADAILFATPEYNSPIPGQLKNAIDWASRPAVRAALRNKPVAVIGASMGMFGAVWAQAELRKVLGASGARVVDRELPVVSADEAFEENGALRDRDLSLELEGFLAELVYAAERRRAA